MIHLTVEAKKNISAEDSRLILLLGQKYGLETDKEEEGKKIHFYFLKIKDPAEDARALGLSFLRELHQHQSLGSLLKGSLIKSKSLQSSEILSGVLVQKSFSGPLHGLCELKALDKPSKPQDLQALQKDFLRVQSWTRIEEILETYMPLRAARLFRSPHDISQILLFLSEKIVEGEWEGVQDMLNLYKGFHLHESHKVLQQNYKVLLNLVFRTYKQNPALKAILANCILSSKTLISKADFDSELNELMSWCIKDQDPRIISSVIDVLGHFSPEDQRIRQSIQSKYNRIATESILIEAKKSLDRSLTHKILEFINSSNPFFVASGLYLVGALSDFYSTKSFKNSEDQKNLQTLIQRSEVFRDHTHSMVRHRARQTLEIIDRLKRAS